MPVSTPIRRSPACRLRRLAPLAAVLALLPAALAAQRRGPLSDARRGDGELTRGDDTVAVVEASAWLGADGRAVVEVASRRETFVFAGTWTQGEREQRLLTIADAMGERANAEGWVITEDGRLSRLAIVGRWGGGRRLHLSFDATADLPARPPVGSGVDAAVAGDGALTRGFGRQPVSQLRVVLRPGGGAEIVLGGAEELRLAGRWRAEDAARVRFEAAGGFGGAPGTGDGTIELRDGRVERVTLAGTSGRHDYRLDFRAADERPTRPPIGPRPGGGELSEQAGYNLEGGDYTSVYFETLRECQAACRRDDRCRAYTYNTRSRTCYLKDRVGRYERRDDTVSGHKGEGR